MINLLYTIQADLYALVILSILFWNHKKKADLSNLGNLIFLMLILSNATALLLEMLLASLNGMPGQATHLILNYTSAFFFCLNPVPCLLWLAYADYFIHGDATRLKRYAIPYALPMVIIWLLSIASIFRGYLYYISPDNFFHRGSLLLIVPVICILYTVFAAFLIFYNRAQIRSDDVLPLLLFGVPPVMGACLQTAHFGLTLLWPGLTIALLLIFVFIQSSLMNTDHLTSLFNRREFDRHLDHLTERGSRKNYIAGIVMDLDHFKRINDIYGHSSGDSALIFMSEILRKSFRKTDFIARVGGDEFSIILELDHALDLEFLLQRLQENLLTFNTSQKAPYQLNVSIGSGVYDPEINHSLHNFFHQLDAQMYTAKKNRSITS